MSGKDETNKITVGDTIAITLSVFSTIAAFVGVYIGFQARNDVAAATRYNAAISACQDADDTYRRFFLKLLDSDNVPFEAYFPGESTTFERSKVDLIDLLNALSYASAEFEGVVMDYVAVVSKFEEPIGSPFEGGFDFGKLRSLVTSSQDLTALNDMPARLKSECNAVLERIRA